MLFTRERTGCQNSFYCFGTPYQLVQNPMNNTQQSRHSGAETEHGAFPNTVTNGTLPISQAGTAAAAAAGKGVEMRCPRSMVQPPPCTWEPVVYAKGYANHSYRNKDGLKFKLVKHLTLQGCSDRLMGERHPFLQSCCLLCKSPSTDTKAFKKQLKPSPTALQLFNN